ncbi:MAG TPA: glycerophosphodiester phosphodiesterase, partial [Burkholderiales bacterium]|nr:glycerophosphodiester phosphodiesterase [Burkholderiales bacterium]
APAYTRAMVMKRFLLPLLLAASGAAAQTIDLQGHRGARGLLPENTLPAFEKALELGVTTLELDIAITRDGVLVIHHDPTLNPDITRDGSGRFLEERGPPIHSLTWEELQKYDVGRLKPGTPYARNYPDQQPLDGARIPRLADLFELVRGNAKVRFAIETKVHPEKPAETAAPEPFARAVVDAIRKAGVAERSQVLSFDWRTLQVVQKVAPEIPTVYLSIQRRMDNIQAGNAAGSPWTAGFRFSEHGSVPRMIKAAGGAYWSVFYNDLTPAALQEAHALGLKVLVWTVNDPAVMERMLALGIDGLITDRPDLAIPLLKARGLRW